MVEKGRLEVEGGADVRAPSVGDWERGEEKLGWQAELGCGRLGRERRLQIGLKEEGGKRNERGSLRVVFRL
jgi:hypothetical protein